MIITSKLIVIVGASVVKIENMWITKRVFERIVKNVRCYSTSENVKQTKLLIQKTTYGTDDWTNISSRFEPFVGANLYQKRSHPLRLTQEEIVDFFRQWFGQNVSDSDFAVFKNLDPIEQNTSTEKDPNAFYVNQNLVLRTHAINREMRYLKSGMNNFAMVLDLYRRCEMDAKHFPAFHRVNIIRTMDCEKLLRRSDRKDAQQAQIAQHLEEEWKAALVELVKHLIGTDVKYRWTEFSNMASAEPASMFELWHQDEWYRISGGGLIRNNILEQSDRPNTAGWEIAIGLDRLAMVLYNIFDIRVLWNAKQSFLKQFEPQNVKSLTALPSEDNSKAKSIANPEGGKTRPTLQKQPTIVPKKTKCAMNISYILPKTVDLETFPVDAFCSYIKNNTENAAEQVD